MSKKKKIALSFLLVAGLVLIIVPLLFRLQLDSANRAHINQFREAAKVEEQHLEKDFVSAYQEHLTDGNLLMSDKLSRLLDDNPEDGAAIELEEALDELPDALREQFREIIVNQKVIATINIPKIKQEHAVYYGTTTNILANAVGIVANTSLPYGLPGEYCVLAGHRGGKFSPIWRDIGALENGDTFTITNDSQRLQYQVYDIKIVTVDQTQYLQPAERDDQATAKVVLVSCDSSISEGRRILLFARLIEKQEL